MNGNEWVELAEREGDGLAVSLFWRPADGATAVGMVDGRLGEFTFGHVPADRAMDAFRHPACYLRPAVVES